MKKTTKRIVIFAVFALCVLALFSCSEKMYDYDLAEYIELGDYPTVKYDEKKLEESIQDSLDAICEEHKEVTEVTDRTTTKEGDVVKVDYVGKVDGKEFAGGSATDSEITIKADSGYIEGFAEGMADKEVGKEFDLNLKFPDPYTKNPDLAGKDVVFTVTVKSISEEKVPELTDEMVKEDTDFDTVEAYKENLKEKWFKTNLWTNFVDSCSVKVYPQKERDELYKNSVSMYMNYGMQYGYTTSNFYQAFGFQSLDDFKQTMLKSANNTVKEEMVICAVSRNNNIEVTDDEYKTLGEAKAKELGAEDLSSLETSYGSKEAVKLELLKDKLVENIVKGTVK